MRRWIAGSDGERDAGRELGAEPEGERVGRSVVVDGQQCLGLVGRLRLLERDPVRVRRPQLTRFGAYVIRREVPEGAGIDDLVDGVLDQDLELEAERVLPEELDHVREIAVVYQRGPRRDRVGDHDPARLEPAVAGGDDRREHPFVDPEPSEPLRDDHVDRFGQLDVDDVAVDHRDGVRDVVRGGQLLRQAAIGVRSTAYTRAAPARAANMLRMPLPAPTSRTMSPGRTIELIARWKASVRTRSRIIVR